MMRLRGRAAPTEWLTKVVEGALAINRVAGYRLRHSALLHGPRILPDAPGCTRTATITERKNRRFWHENQGDPRKERLRGFPLSCHIGPTIDAGCHRASPRLREPDVRDISVRDTCRACAQVQIVGLPGGSCVGETGRRSA
jgi:hypothetical protein